jgi:hypothetical protein
MAMGTERVLARVRGDIESGDLGLARLRLQSALGPTGADDVRRELVRVCRLSGDPAAAGRFGYLTDEIEDHETEAFEARHGGRATLILRAIGPIHDVERLSPEVRARLRALEERKADDPPGVGAVGAVGAGATDWRDTAFVAGCVAALLVLLAIFVVGLVATVRLALHWLS